MSVGLLWKDRLSVAMLVVAVALLPAMGTGCSSTKKSTSDLEAAGDASRLSEDKLGGRGSLGEYEATGEISGQQGRFEDVYFQFDSAQLDPTALAAVRRNAEILQKGQDDRVEIEGHCDERGTAEYNLALGARRAKAVRDALVGQGISSTRLSTVSYGEELPVCKDATGDCYARNRRAHIVDLTR